VFIQQLYGAKTRIRFRPSFFPFTEPSAEVDMSCFACHGKGCSVCGNAGWIEVMGRDGPPERFPRGRVRSRKVLGFAFGLGVDRVAMIKHGIDDIRLFLGNDLRFLRQF